MSFFELEVVKESLVHIVDPSIHFEHLFSAVRRVADQAVVGWIDDEIQELQRNLADEYGRVVREFDDINLAFPTLDC